ncbi:hypothetical protein ABW21_db0205423 [Orbilia brochopaga]|nr:hypothetical protein ABW21_db0205423 [Drechslerella brochopaga]
MQVFYKGTVEEQIRRVKRQAAKKANSVLAKYHKACRQSQELEQQIQDSHKETTQLLVPLLEQGADLRYDPEAAKLAEQLEKKIGKIGDQIKKTKGKIEVYNNRRQEIHTDKEAKVEALKSSTENPKAIKLRIEGSEDSVVTSVKLEKIVENWLNTRLNRRPSFYQPLQRSKSLKQSTSQGLRVRWSEELFTDDTRLIYPTESTPPTSGEISRSTSAYSLRPSTVSVEAAVDFPANAVTEGLALEVTVVKEGSRRQFNPIGNSPSSGTEEKFEKPAKKNTSQRSLNSIITIPEEGFLDI